MVSPRGEGQWLAQVAAARFPRRHARRWLPRLAAGGVGALTLVAGVGAVAGGSPGVRSAADPLTGIRIDMTSTSPRAVDPVRPKPANATPSTVAAPPATAVAAVAPPPVAPGPKVVPLGKGMWLHQLSMAGNDPFAVVNQAKAAGLTHVYLRLGSSKSAFYDQDELNRLLPVAHAGGIKVIGWDFPYLFDPAADAARAKSEIDYTTPTGDRIDGFAADVESESEGVNISAATASAYGAALRQQAGAGYPLIAVVPRPTKRIYPYAQLIASFDAVAPMVYWMNNDPAATVAQVIDAFAPLGKPVMPVGQAYNGAIDHGPAGSPSKADLERFMQTSAAHGAIGVSFWVWQLASPDEWAAITEDHHFELAPMAAGPNDAGRVTFLQRLMNAFGVAIPVDGRFGEGTRSGVLALQRRFGLAPTGDFDSNTLNALFGRR